MDSKKLLHAWWVLPISILLQLSNLKNWANAAPQVPCYFIFGDSLSDSGNNNNLRTRAKVNYPPYGIDFPRGPTGRFSDGRNVQDVIVQLLGFHEFIPPFAISKTANILQGVNYASGCAGILDETGRQMGARVPMNTQIRNHKTIIDRIRMILKSQPSVDKLLSRCIYSIQIGSNDYLNNYFKPNFYDSSHRQNSQEFATTLIQQYSRQIEALYGMGARLFAFYGLSPLGCTPSAISAFGTNGSLCVEMLNDAANLFNDRLIALVMELNNKHKDARFTYLYASPMLPGAESFDFMNPCCKIGGGGGELCIHNSVPCSNPRRFVFWDGVHPTDAYNVLVANSLYGTGQSPSESQPFDIRSLAQQIK